MDRRIWAKRALIKDFRAGADEDRQLFETLEAEGHESSLTAADRESISIGIAEYERLIPIIERQIDVLELAD